MSKKKGKYFKQQQRYFMKSRKQKLENFNDYTTQVVADSYILLNPAFPVETTYALLNVHNKIKAGMLIKGKPEDFADNPNQVYKVIKERKVLTVKKPNQKDKINQETRYDNAFESLPKIDQESMIDHNNSQSIHHLGKEDGLNMIKEVIDNGDL